MMSKHSNLRIKELAFSNKGRNIIAERANKRLRKNLKELGVKGDTQYITPKIVRMVMLEIIKVVQ